MTDLMSQALAEQQATPSADKVEVWSLEVLHPAIVDEAGNRTSVRAVNQPVDMMLPLEDTAPLNAGETVSFTAIPFEVPWPEVDDAKAPEIRFRIDNIGREVLAHLAAAVRVNAALTIIVRAYLWSQSTGAVEVAMDPVSLELLQVTVNDQYVEGTASPGDLPNLQFLRVIYDVEHYPGLTQS